MGIERQKAGLARIGTPLAFRGIATNYGLVVVFLVVVLGFSLARPESYFTLINLQTIASTSAVLAILALAAIPPLVIGQFDLSIGFQLALAQSIGAALIIRYGLSPAIASVIVIAVGLVIGICNGTLVAYAGLNAFITTLATGILLQGASQLVTNGEAIYGSMPAWWLGIGRAEIIGIPLPFVYVVLVATVLWRQPARGTIGRTSRPFADLTKLCSDQRPFRSGGSAVGLHSRICKPQCGRELHAAGVCGSLFGRHFDPSRSVQCLGNRHCGVHACRRYRRPAAIRCAFLH
jgi:hypothetical protein